MPRIGKVCPHNLQKIANHCRVIMQSKPCTEKNLFHAITMYLVITLCDEILYCFLTVLKGVNGAVGSRNKATVFHG